MLSLICFIREQIRVKKRASYRHPGNYLGFRVTIWDSTLKIWDSYLDYKSGTYMFVNMRKDPHIWFVLIALCFLVFVATGCKKARLRAQLKDMMTSTIVLPESIICVYNGEVFPMPDSLRDKPKLIVYIDSTECTTCRISHFWEYQELFDISKEIGSFEIMLLLCNKAFNSIPMTRYLSDRELEYPIYIDLDYRFLSLNPSIPTDPRLHSMLIDSTGRPIFVGDPSKSGQMMEAFSLALEHNYN